MRAPSPRTHVGEAPRKVSILEVEQAAVHHDQAEDEVEAAPTVQERGDEPPQLELVRDAVRQERDPVRRDELEQYGQRDGEDPADRRPRERRDLGKLGAIPRGERCRGRERRRRWGGGGGGGGGHTRERSGERVSRPSDAFLHTDRLTSSIATVARARCARTTSTVFPQRTSMTKAEHKLAPPLDHSS